MFFWGGCTSFTKRHCPPPPFFFFPPKQPTHTMRFLGAHSHTAFRHSLAPANTISVTFHYMVLAKISGLESHQISTQGAPQSHAQYCLAATMSNCSCWLLYLFDSNQNRCNLMQLSKMLLENVSPPQKQHGRIPSEWETFMLTLRLVWERAAV